MVPILIIMNNYFHDVATAFLLSGAIVLIVFVRTVETDGRKDVIDFFLNNYDRFVKIVRFSVAWIVIAGVPRILNYMEYEYEPAVGKNLIVAIIIKHVLVFTFITLGVLFWRDLFKRINRLREEGS